MTIFAFKFRTFKSNINPDVGGIVEIRWNVTSELKLLFVRPAEKEKERESSCTFYCQQLHFLS